MIESFKNLFDSGAYLRIESGKLSSRLGGYLDVRCSVCSDNPDGTWNIHADIDEALAVKLKKLKPKIKSHKNIIWYYRK